MLDDHWRKAVAAIGNFSHRASLSSVSLPGYPGYPDKAGGTVPVCSREPGAAMVEATEDGSQPWALHDSRLLTRNR